jgi:hypothetical protein
LSLADNYSFSPFADKSNMTKVYYQNRSAEIQRQYYHLGAKLWQICLRWNISAKEAWRIIKKNKHYAELSLLLILFAVIWITPAKAYADDDFTASNAYFNLTTHILSFDATYNNTGTQAYNDLTLDVGNTSIEYYSAGQCGSPTWTGNIPIGTTHISFLMCPNFYSNSAPLPTSGNVWIRLSSTPQLYSQPLDVTVLTTAPTPSPTPSPTPTPTPTPPPILSGIVQPSDCGVFQTICDYTSNVANQILYWLLPDTTYFNDNLTTITSTIDSTAPFCYVDGAYEAINSITPQTLTPENTMAHWDFSFDVPTDGFISDWCSGNCGTQESYYHVPLVFQMPYACGSLGQPACDVNGRNPYDTIRDIQTLFQDSFSALIYISLFLFLLRIVRRFFQ